MYLMAQFFADFVKRISVPVWTRSQPRSLPAVLRLVRWSGLRLLAWELGTGTCAQGDKHSQVSASSHTALPALPSLLKDPFFRKRLPRTMRLKRGSGSLLAEIYHGSQCLSLVQIHQPGLTNFGLMRREWSRDLSRIFDS